MTYNINMNLCFVIIYIFTFYNIMYYIYFYKIDMKFYNNNHIYMVQDI